DTLPKRVWWGWAEVEGGSCRRASGSRRVTCSFGRLQAGELAVARLRTWLFPSAQRAVNVAEADSTTPDPHPANNRSRFSYDVG
ncbi:MAG: hypothetical protein ACRDNG_08915, partial [Gaiellaceae bacterium]